MLTQVYHTHQSAMSGRQIGAFVAFMAAVVIGVFMFQGAKNTQGEVETEVQQQLDAASQ